MGKLTLIFVMLFISGAYIRQPCIFAQEGLVVGAGTINDAAQPQPEAKQRPALEYKAEGVKDPFKAPIKKEKKPVVEATKEEKIDKPLPELTIKGLIWGGTIPQAIINDQVVKAGDTISEVQIESISREGVTVSFNGRTYSLPSPAMASLEEIERKAKGGTDEK